MVIASERAVERFGLTPRARVLGMASAGVDPRIMGIGPVPAIEKLTARIKRSLSEFDIIEINEAFAAQVIACMRKLNVDPLDERVNPNGGAIALGHPLGTSGARLVMTATHALQAGSGKSALVTMCVGVGQGLALAIERV
jgi:3-oxoadipyl-CoA thiolase